jgi:hypothetical protein
LQDAEKYAPDARERLLALVDERNGAAVPVSQDKVWDAAALLNWTGVLHRAR